MWNSRVWKVIRACDGKLLWDWISIYTDTEKLYETCRKNKIQKKSGTGSDRGPRQCQQSCWQVHILQMNDTYDIEPPCEPGCTTALHFTLITWMVLEELMFMLECYHNRFQGLWYHVGYDWQWVHRYIRPECLQHLFLYPWRIKSHHEDATSVIRWYSHQIDLGEDTNGHGSLWINLESHL